MEKPCTERENSRGELGLSSERVSYEVEKVEERLVLWFNTSKFPPTIEQKTFPYNEKEDATEKEITELFFKGENRNNDFLLNGKAHLLRNINKMIGVKIYLLADFSCNQNELLLPMIQQANLLAEKNYVFFNGLGSGNSIFSPAHVQIIQPKEISIKPRHFESTFYLEEVPELYQKLLKEQKLVVIVFLGNGKVGIVEQKLDNLSREEQIMYLLLGPSAIELGSNVIVDKNSVLKVLLKKDLLDPLKKNFLPDQITQKEQRIFYKKITNDM